ncbi:unnamed protein product [Ectocarpus sp. CCAP 1310/34]|nr:unnamed protein product [Ectocarpus sp. CCAP 1310/34]
MRAATMNASSPVVWPPCAVALPASSAFQQPKAGRVKAKPLQPILRESSSGEDSGWSSAGVSRRPPEPSSLAGDDRARQQAKRQTSGTRGKGGGSGSGSDRSLIRKHGARKGPSSRQQVKRSLDGGAPGPDAFQLLLRHLAEQFDVGDRQESVLRLQQFGVADGTPFADYLRAFRLLVSSVTDSERTLAPSVSMVLEIVRNSVDKQFPSLSPLL